MNPHRTNRVSGGTVCGRSRGFSLIELLVSIAVLSIILLLLLGIVGAVTQTWQRGRALAEVQREARTMLDLIDRDLQSAIGEPILPEFSPDRLVFYATRPSAGGSGSGDRRFVCVEYRLGSDGVGLERREYDLGGWSANPEMAPLGEGQLPAVPMTDFRVSENVVGFYFDFLSDDGNYEAFSETADAPYAAVRVGLAVLDDLAIRQLSDQGLSDRLNQVMARATPDPGIAAAWLRDFEDAIRAEGASGFPIRVREGLRFFEKTMPIPRNPA